MNEQYTELARKALEAAQRCAREMKHSYVGTEHLLVGLVEVREAAAAQILIENGMTAEKLRNLIAQLQVEGGRVAVREHSGYSPRAQRVLDIAQDQARRYRSEKIGTEHILLAIILEGENVSLKLLESVGINPMKVYFETLAAMGENPQEHRNDLAGAGPQAESGFLDQYSRDLTRLAAEGQLDPVVGREDEIRRVIQILSRRTKNNPCLIGEPGVGKTAIVEGLAQQIANGDVPATVRDKRLLTLDLSGMVAGTKYRGEFEERVKQLLQEVAVAGNIILFVDEVHTLIGAGGAEGSIDASNMLKPALARGEMQLIGATTISEYRKHIEKDAALERRFQPVQVEEPTEAEAIEILKGIVHRYEEHHAVRVEASAIQAAVKLSQRYINDRNLPDKAIDVIDEACAAVRLSHLDRPGTDQKLMKVEQEIYDQDAQIAEALLAGDVKKASRLRGQVERKIRKLESMEEKAPQEESLPSVTEEDVARVISIWAKVPVTQLTEKEGERLARLEKVLHGRVIGQEDAVGAVARAIRRGRVGLQDPKRPIGSFLFLGPTGVGKTELSKALAEAVFGSEKELIRVDMSEYMEQYAVSKMIGSAPGYVGFEEGGQLSEQVRRHPYSVVLFDEIEKAHHDVFNILLQILDDGRITDSQGHTVNFKNTIIIMTSNVGAQRIVDPKVLGFGAKPTRESSYEQMKTGVMEEVKKLFRPEFINRIDEILVFHTLSDTEMEEVVGLQLAELTKRAKAQMGLTLRVTAGLKKHLASTYADVKMGARPLKRAIQTVIEDPLTDRILSGEITEGQTVTIGYSHGKVVFR